MMLKSMPAADTVGGVDARREPYEMAGRELGVLRCSRFALCSRSVRWLIMCTLRAHQVAVGSGLGAITVYFLSIRSAREYSVVVEDFVGGGHDVYRCIGTRVWPTNSRVHCDGRALNSTTMHPSQIKSLFDYFLVKNILENILQNEEPGRRNKTSKSRMIAICYK